MNDGIYRLVFNKERNSWVAVAENVRGRGKKSSRRRLAAVVLGLVAAVGGDLAQAGPLPPSLTQLPVPSTGARPFVFAGAVNGGQPTTSMVNGINTLRVDTLSRMLGLNWQKFDIGSNAEVIFNQPDATSRILNRIWDNDPSQILGRLTANGQIYLINQNGILFGNGAQVNVGGLVASALNLSEGMTNRLLNSGLPSAKGDSLEFAWDGSLAAFNAGSVIVEAGAEIRTPSGGRVVLIAPKTVENRGLIASGGGAEAILAAGGKVILTAPDDPSLRGLLVETRSFAGKDAFGTSATVDGSVTNSGRIDTGAGGVISLAALAVNQKGIVNASKAINLNGTTMLVSGSGTTDTDHLTINQRGDVAQIDWVSGFNVSAGKTVEFVQPSAGAVAYNYVYDPDRTLADGSTLSQASRSSIDGILKASGQFVLINEKGIDFGANARASASNFVASALGMNPILVTTGLLGQTDVTKRAFYLNKTPSVSFVEGEVGLDQKLAPALAAFRDARVKVSVGAQIESLENGYVILAGGQVEQGGTILAGRTAKTDASGNPIYKGGQVVLAAGADLYLKPGFSSAVRGFTAEVNPLVALRTARFDRDTNGNILLDANGDPQYVSENSHWVAISRGALNANRVVNTGYIGANLGDISVVGYEITQAGTMQTSTSTTMNGSIHLAARDTLNVEGAGEPTVLAPFYRKFDAQGVMAANGISFGATEPDSTQFIAGSEGGSLTFARGSRTVVAIDGSDGKTATTSQIFVKSSIDALAQNVVVEAADIEAKGGRIQLRGMGTFSEMTAFGVDPATPSQGAAPAGVGVFVADGARIDVSGTNASKSVADLFIQAELRGDEFANNAVQRNGKLRGLKAWFDVRDSVAVADLSGWLNGVGLTVNELAATGGTISLGSTGSVVVKSNARLDVSGGKVDYAAGLVQESHVIGFGGQRYRLNDAPVSALYAGLVTTSHREAGYVEGRSAGKLEVVGRDLALDGQLSAHTTVGTRQRVVGGDPSTNRYAIPYGGQLIVKDGGQHYPVADRDTATEAEKMAAYTQAQVVFVRGAANSAAQLNSGDAVGPRLELSQSLIDNGFSRISVTSDGRIDIPADVSLKLPAGGSFAASGRQVYVAGDISAPSGSIALSTRDLSAAGNSFPGPIDAKYSNLVVDSGSTLSTAAQWVNDRLDGALSKVAKSINGGAVNLSSVSDLDVRAGSNIDVSGGGWVNGKGVLKAGDAGSIVLASNTGAGYAFAGVADSVFLGGTLAGYALGKGGSLTVKSSRIDFGQPYTQDSRNWSVNKRIAENQIGTVLDAGFVDRGGFFQFAFEGRTGVTVANGLNLQPDPVSWSLAKQSNFAFRPTGTDIANFATLGVLHPDLRSGPTKLSLTTTDPLLGKLLVGESAYLGVSPQGSINLEASGQLTVLGTLEAPGGTISLSRAKVSALLKAQYATELQSESIYLGPNSKLLARGTTVLTAATRQAIEAGQSADALRAKQRYFGKVLDGGRVTADAGLGYLVTRAGSVIDVSGADDVLNIASSTGQGVSYAAQSIGSAGGSVSFKAHAGMLLDGSFVAGGGHNALGGVFSLSFAADSNEANPWGVSIDNTQSDEERAVVADRVLTLYQSASGHTELWPANIDSTAYLAGNSQALLNPVDFSGKARVDLGKLSEAGFGSWYLSSQNEIRFAGAINATLNNQLALGAPRFSATDDASNVYLRAAAAWVGNAASETVPVASASIGNAAATISAQDIALVGTFSWNGFGSSRFVSDGAIHFDSVLKSAALRTGGSLFNGQMTASGNLEFAAARLSPATYSDFRIDLHDDPRGSITISRPEGVLADVSLSPFGRLEFAAPSITQAGTITAPLGQVVFNAPGGSVTLTKDSVTSVAANRDLLFGQTTESGATWTYNGLVVSALPAKGIVIDGAKTTVATGAKLDLSAGGDALAWEFTAGPGGKKDVLAAASGTYAIVPGWAGFSATDGELQKGYLFDGLGTTVALNAGDRITLGNNPYGLNGSYVLLPARYAVLPGSYLVTVKSGNDATLGGALRQADGSWLVAGQRVAVNQNGSTTVYGTSPLTLELASSTQVAGRARYVMTSANQFFYDQTGVILPGDAGRLSAVGRQSLTFDPAVVAMLQAEIAAADGRKRVGRGMELDLASPRLLVSDAVTAPDASWTLIDQGKLNALGASSVLLGGVRSVTGGKTNIETVASELRVANSQSALAGSELLFTAKDELVVKSGSRIESTGVAEARQIVLNDDGAFLRVAEGAQATVQRGGDVQRSTGDLRLESNAVVAGRALYLDATRNNVLNGDLLLGVRQADGSRGKGGALAIGAGHINVVGDNSVPADGLTLRNADLLRFASADEIRLASYSTLDLYGNAVLGTADLKKLTVSAGGIAGYGDANSRTTISANSVVFENQNPRADSTDFLTLGTLGRGTLAVSAASVEFASNATPLMRTNETAGFALGGFDKVNITASGDLRFAGTGVVRVDNSVTSGAPTDLNIDAGRVVTVGTANHLLTASGTTTVIGGNGASSDTGLGGALELRASAFDIAGKIETPGGKLVLRADGNNGVMLRRGAVLAAEGRKVAFDDTYAYSPGGSISIVADAGNVTVQEGAKVSVSADPAGGDAGTLTLTAQSGVVSAGKATLFGSASKDSAQGNLRVDAKQLDLNELADAVNDGTTRQMAGSWAIRSRDGSLALNKRIVSTDVSIATDNGGIEIGSTGEIDASGSKGGRIALFSRDGDLSLFGKLIAQGREFIADINNAGTRGQGGTVILAASGTGKVDAKQGSVIDVDTATRQTDAGTELSKALGGKVTFRAPSPNFTVAGWENNLNIHLAGVVVGASDVGAELYYTETGTSLKTGNSNTGTKIVGLDGTSSSIKKKLTTDFSSANMATLRSALGFTDPTVQHVRPGVEILTPNGGVSDFTVASDLDFKTLRFAGEAGVLTIRASGDLKVNGTIDDGFAGVARNAVLNTNGQSWSYRLVAGADQSAADPMAFVAPPAGIGNDPLGNKGNLEVLANKLIRTGTGEIQVAARRNIKLNQKSAIYTAGLADAAGVANFTPAAVRGVTAPFAGGGGDISLVAGENIEMVSSSTSGRHINEWLYRVDNTTKNTQWWSQIASFQEGLAAFGGGDISVSSGKSISNLTVAIPTNGRVPRVNGVDQPDSAVILGGGDLSVHAGDAIAGGLFYVETGKLHLDAGTLSNNVGLAMGNAVAEVVANGDIQLGNVFNPLWVKTQPVNTNGASETASGFGISAPRIGTYNDRTALEVTSVAGNVTLKPTSSFYGVPDGEAGTVMPSRVKVAALNGDIDISGSLVQAPGGNGQLDLLASNAIALGLGSSIQQLDLPASLLPSLHNPIKDGASNGRSQFVLSSLATIGAAREAHANTLWHADDYEPSRLIALNGSITGKVTNDASLFNEAVRIEAAGDITNLPVEIQHAHASDISLLQAGGEIKFDNRTSAGEVTSPSRGIHVAGLGAVDVIAGKSVDLGDSEGIVTVGNLDNPYLSSGGADIFAMAGGKPNYDGFRTYLGVGKEVGEAELRTRFFVALRDFGKLAQSTGDKSYYEKGRSLVSIVFPQANVGKGDILLSVSQIKTEQGGDIQLLAPGGSVVVGVAAPTLTKKASQQGIFSVNGGDIFAFVEKNFLVNQSRVFSLNGGDIMIWANHGNIDAGSGSKTAVSTPPPVLVIRNGQIVLDTSNSVSGSGIGVLASRDDTPPSDMALFAPDGAIDAGDAGLRSTGNITLGARVILNASNIQAAGAVSGAPAPVAAAAPVVVPTTPTNTENKALEDAAPAAGKKGGAGGILTVEVLDSDPVAEPSSAPKKEDDRKGKSRTGG